MGVAAVVCFFTWALKGKPVLEIEHSSMSEAFDICLAKGLELAPDWSIYPFFVSTFKLLLVFSMLGSGLLVEEILCANGLRSDWSEISPKGTLFIGFLLYMG